jgi:selenocysteine lyase/cysteine desulfurase
MIYLDHAATSHPKPAPVLQAMLHWYTALGVSAARGDSERCGAVARAVAATRSLVGKLCGVRGERVAFTSGATESLNLALRAILQPGDRVLTTAFEHSSVVRPLLRLASERQLRIEVLPMAADGTLDLDHAAATCASLRPRWLVATHASNVTGALFDAAALADIAHQHGARLLLDASQTAGYCDLAVGADLVVASAHKALHGPAGLGFLALAEGLWLPPQKQGGTGSSQALAEHPETFPESFEAGTPNTPAILGLQAALEWLATTGRQQLWQRGLAHLQQLEAGLQQKPGVRLLRPAGPRVPVLSFVHAAFDPAELGGMLDAAGVHARTGFHCAPWLHASLGTATAGTVRWSPGPELSADDIQQALAAVPD